MGRCAVLLIGCLFAAWFAGESQARAAVQPCGPFWSPVGTLAVPSGDSLIPGDLAVTSPTDAWVTGNITPTDSATGFPITAIVEHWNGSSWTLTNLPGPPHWTDFYQASAAVSFAGSALVVGNSDSFLDNGGVLFEQWNGSSWSYRAGGRITPAPNFASLSAIASVSPSNIWVSGDASPLAHFYEHWNGASWTFVPPPAEPHPQGITADHQIQDFAVVSASNIWAVGLTDWQDNGNTSDTLIEHYNGSNWSVVPSPQPGPLDRLNGVYAASATNVYAVGEGGSTGLTPLIVHWNGSEWSQITPPPAPSGTNPLTVAGIGAHDIWMLGEAASGQAYMAHYDGHRWTQIATASSVGQIATSSIGAAVVTQGQFWSMRSGNGAGGAQRLCPEPATDAGFEHVAVTVPLGATPEWTAPATNTATRTLSDSSIVHVFTNVAVAPGYSATPGRFVFSGTYPIHDQSGHTETVGVPPLLSARSVTAGGKINLAWSAVVAPIGEVFDVQVKRPGQTTFQTIAFGLTSRSMVFATTTAGSYQFRARLRVRLTGTALAWSPTATLMAH